MIKTQEWQTEESNKRKNRTQDSGEKHLALNTPDMKGKT
jgi:hypothetical protein